MRALRPHGVQIRSWGAFYAPVCSTQRRSTDPSSGLSPPYRHANQAGLRSNLDDVFKLEGPCAGPAIGSADPREQPPLAAGGRATSCIKY
jgi:hypothetical protein